MSELIPMIPLIITNINSSSQLITSTPTMVTTVISATSMLFTTTAINHTTFTIIMATLILLTSTSTTHIITTPQLSTFITTDQLPTLLTISWRTPPIYTAVTKILPTAFTTMGMLEPINMDQCQWKALIKLNHIMESEIMELISYIITWMHLLLVIY